ncbi:MAG: endolytic transglycosylase MltG [Erysipelothrix sp.]|nr:endolytic transglycosylase MltG [Erysipelothrix sp.]
MKIMSITTKKKKIWPKLLLVVVLILAGSGVFGYNYYQQLNEPVSSSSQEVAFTVPSGASISTVLTQLEEDGLIRSAFATKIKQQLSPVAVDLKAGEFTLDTSWDAQEMLQFMSNSQNILVDVVNLTFIDGERATDYARVIESKLGIPATEVLETWNDPEYLASLIDTYEVLTDDILSSDVRYALEGYLAPNTYQFFLDADVKDVTKRLLDQSEKFYLENKTLFDNSQLSIHEVFNLSSIVQLEAKYPEDMKLVASVFHNRLALPMRLESSVTVCYALDQYTSWQECESNVGIESPYNTYRVDGLPVGPIANPGANALLAVLDPVESNYYFFMSEMYGDTQGTFHYAETFAEHEKNVNQYLRGNQ